MGKTPKPLSILLIPPLDEWPEIHKLRDQGHTIQTLPDIARDKAMLGWDLILGPTCHRMTEHERKYLHLAIAEGWRVKYGKETK